MGENSSLTLFIHISYTVNDIIEPVNNMNLKLSHYKVSNIHIRYTGISTGTTYPINVDS